MTTFQILQLEPGQAQPVAVRPLYQDAQFPMGSIHSTLTSFPRQLQAWLEWREVQRAAEGIHSSQTGTLSGVHDCLPSRELVNIQGQEEHKSSC